MSYSAEISRRNPTCIFLLIDQSGSMADPWAGNPEKRKAQNLALIVNRLFTNLLIDSTKEEGVRDYFHIGAIGYGAVIAAAFSGALSGREIVPISEIAQYPSRIDEIERKVEDGAGGLVTQRDMFPVWIDPVSNGNTPMREAFAHVHRVLSDWLIQHRSAFPPIVIHLTDGESTDGDPTEMMKAITRLSSDDGNVLLFNIHISGNSALKPIPFPVAPMQFDDPYAQMLFDTASFLTPYQRKRAAGYGVEASEMTKGFIFNADPVGVITALDIGSKNEPVAR